MFKKAATCSAALLLAACAGTAPEVPRRPAKDGAGGGAQAKETKAQPPGSGAPFPREGPGKSSNHVAITDFSFSPDTTQVSAGAEVTWHNEDPTEHTVTAADGAFDSEALGSRHSFTFRFDEPGRYAYLCEIHPDMRAVLSVE